MQQRRVIIIGGGFAGLHVAKGLANTSIDVTLIDKTNHHLFQPLLYEVATAAISPKEIAIPIREIFRTAKNVNVLMGEVTQVDPSGKTILLGNGEMLSFDSLVIATGARHSYFGNNTWEAFAPGLKTIADAIHIREHILLSFEKAERIADPKLIEPYMNFVIIGAGPTGVEMAGAIAAVSKASLEKNFRKIRPETARIYLIEATTQVLPVYPEKLSIRAKKDLETMGVTVMTGKKVTNITKNGVFLGDLFIPSENVIWAAGNQAPSFLESLGVPRDKQQRIIVEKDLSIPNHPDIFVIGDSAHAKDKKGNPLPGIAPTAIQQGSYLAKLLKKNLSKEHRKPFSYFDKGTMATIGKSKAVALFRKFCFSGFFAWLMWCFIHILYLIGFRNRFSVLITWIVIFISDKRGVRIIYRSIDEELPKVLHKP